MDVQTLLSHYQESQDAFWQSWGFLCRSYLLLRKVNPLLGDGIVVLGGLAGLLAALEVFTLVSKIFSEKYITALCNFQKGICKILHWVFRQIRNTLSSLLVFCRFLRRKTRQKSVVALSETETINRKQLAIETRSLLLEVLATDARHRTAMRPLLREADTKLRILDRGDCASLVQKALIETKGTAIKRYAQSILEICNF
jgi:hypothetical protein